jgi:hypothetical protein
LGGLGGGPPSPAFGCECITALSRLQLILPRRSTALIATISIPISMRAAQDKATFAPGALNFEKIVDQ